MSKSVNAVKKVARERSFEGKGNIKETAQTEGHLEDDRMCGRDVQYWTEVLGAIG
jgi:hypothetical protein